MSLKLSDIKARKADRFPDFILDAEDEKGQELELHFRSILVLDEEGRKKVADIFEHKIAVKDATSEGVLAGIKEVFTLTARDPYHFEVLDEWVEANNEPGDDPSVMWSSIFELYSEATHLGEASASAA